MSPRVRQLALWTGLGGILLLTAYFIINTTFMMYDDEGYVLLTYRNFNAGKHLYDEIFSQYGPWPYVYHLIIGLGLGEPLTHMAGRNLTALHWVCSAMAAGLIAGRITGRTVAAVFCCLATFGLLWQMSSEPSHPGSLISATLAIASLLSVISYQRDKGTWQGVVVGVAGALLVLTKINVGIFFLAGAGLAALRFTTWPESWRRPANLAGACGLLFLPWALMGKKIGEPWVLEFAILFTGAAGGMLWVTPIRGVNRSVSPRTWLTAAGIFIGTIFAVISVVCLRGTSITSVLQAVLVDPLRHPASFMISVRCPAYLWPVTAVCWAIALRAGWELRAREKISPMTRNMVIAVRFVAAFAFIFQAEPWLTITGIKGFMLLSFPLIPLFLIPLASKLDVSEKFHEANSWLACLALPQVLHAYPVAGSQMGWGSFLLVPVMVIGVYDATQWLRFNLPGMGRRLFRFTWSILFLTGAVQLGLLIQTGWTRYHNSKPLGLPGAEDVRAGDRITQVLRAMTLNASLHADVLFSRPGMFSYNIWSGVPTPTDSNATHWFWLLNQSEQTRIVDQLRLIPRSAIVTSGGLDEFLASINVPMTGPLQDYILANYRPLFTFGDMHFLVPSTSSAVPFGQWELFVPPTPSPETAYPFLLKTNVVLQGAPARVQLRKIFSPWEIVDEFPPDSASVVLEPIDSRGNLSGPPLKVPAAQTLRGLFRLSVYTRQKPHFANPHEVVLQIVDASGTTLSESIN